MDGWLVGVGRNGWLVSLSELTFPPIANLSTKTSKTSNSRGGKP